MWAQHPQPLKRWSIERLALVRRLAGGVHIQASMKAIMTVAVMVSVLVWGAGKAIDSTQSREAQVTAQVSEVVR